MLHQFLFVGIAEPPSDAKFACDKCGKKYKHRENMKRHRDKECGVEPGFICALCPFKTKRKESLMLHMATKHDRI
ncbi:hypothetical protein J6590_014868 [Homalodisca vitripennis]|nr:hypothetical protein J6590_014868 [Homalodisca vitripennis]